MLVGPRLIEGQIREREEAQRLYQDAKASGRKASLLEQERPNIFTTAVANIAPHELVEVAIEYQDTVPYDGAEFALRFPLVVAPRYPGSDAGECESDGVPPFAIESSDMAALRAATGLEAGATVAGATDAGATVGADSSTRCICRSSSIRDFLSSGSTVRRMRSRRSRSASWCSWSRWPTTRCRPIAISS